MTGEIDPRTQRPGAAGMSEVSVENRPLRQVERHMIVRLPNEEPWYQVDQINWGSSGRGRVWLFDRPGPAPLLEEEAMVEVLVDQAGIPVFGPVQL